MRPCWFYVCLMPLVALAAGCGGGNPGNRLPTVSVSGTVTLDGKTFGPGTVEFISTAPPDTPTRNGIGRVSSSGTFTATSYTEGDGLVPGEYQVHLMPASDDPAATHIPVQPFTVKISESGESGLVLDLKSGAKDSSLDLLNSRLETRDPSMNYSAGPAPR